MDKSFVLKGCFWICVLFVGIVLGMAATIIFLITQIEFVEYEPPAKQASRIEEVEVPHKTAWWVKDDQRRHWVK